MQSFSFRECKDAGTISLFIDTSISTSIDVVLDCPHLKILLLCENKFTLISEKNFKNLKYLTMLDLSGTMIKSAENLKRVKFHNLSRTVIKKVHIDF